MVEVKGILYACYLVLVSGKAEFLEALQQAVSENKVTNTIQRLEKLKPKFSILFDQYVELLKGNRAFDQEKVKCFSVELTDLTIEFSISYEQFLECLNIARNTTIEYLYTSTELSAEEKVEGISLVNHFFFLLNSYTYDYSTKKKNEELKRKTRFIERMNHDRLTILGKISTSFAHEFRNPLTSIKGFIQLLEDKVTNDVQAKQYINIINKEIVNLEQNVSQFLLLSNDKNHEDYNETCFCLVELLEEVVCSLHPAFLDKNIRVIKTLEKPLFIKGIHQQIKQVVIHIINNAIDALLSEPNHRIIFIESFNEDGMACITVQNNGPKIPEDLLENIFEPFISTKELASGLGLSVCKQIIDKHNGELLCHSTKELTTFTLKLKQHK